MRTEHDRIAYTHDADDYTIVRDDHGGIIDVLAGRYRAVLRAGPLFRADAAGLPPMPTDAELDALFRN